MATSTPRLSSLPLDDNTMQKHPEFWYSDGSVVLEAENRRFKVHKTILGYHSDVFADLFAVSQPSSLTDEGVPILPLPDSADDIEDVLKALYIPFYFDTLQPDMDLSRIINFVSGILRISSKYCIRVLRKKCIDVLRIKFPSSLKDCDALLSSQYQYLSSAVVRAIPLARETNVPEILPWAFYISTHISPDALLDNPVLSWRDKALCLAGMERLWELQKTVTHPFLFSFNSSAGCVMACSSRMPQMKFMDVENLRLSAHPLEPYTGWHALNVCPKCVTHWQYTHEEARKKAWQELPTIFKLGSWEDIKKDQDCA